jgi:hypothetical protein
MTISELLPSVASLSHAEKFRLVQIVLRQLAEEEGITGQPPAEDSNPRSYYGAAQQSQQAVDDYLASAREGWTLMRYLIDTPIAISFSGPAI